MSQIVVEKIKLPKNVVNHLRIEMEMWKKEDEYKIARANERKTFRGLLKENGKLERYNEVTEKIRELKKSPNPDIKQYIELLKEKTEITMTIKSNSIWQKVHEIKIRKGQEYRESYKALRTDFANNILPILLTEIESE